jgi:3-oxoacyl-[acyl-carrier protein] reductase
MSSLPGLGRLKGKVVIVTGAGAGFGQAIVKKVTEEGAKALAVDMRGENAKETADAMPKGSCVALTGNVTSEADWRRMLAITVSELGPPDVLVNCAGVIHNAAPSHTVAEEQYDLIMAVNVKPLYLSTKVIVAYWKENGHEGLVINLSSTGESRPRPNLVWYNASKGAVTVVCVPHLLFHTSDKTCSSVLVKAYRITGN